MRLKSTLRLAAAALGLSMVTLAAAPAGVSMSPDLIAPDMVAPDLIAPDLAASPRPVGYYYYGEEGYYGHRPACPYRYYYACWSDPYGRPQCGCKPGIGFYLFRFY